MPTEIEMFRPGDIARRLGITSSRVYQLIAEDVIPSVRIAGAIRIPRAAWETWLQTRSQEALARVHGEES